jgi:uncharacterized protein
MNTTKTTGLFLVILLVVGTTLGALPSRPQPPRLVNDFVSLLTPQEQAALESKLAVYDRTHSTQIAVVITRDLAELEIADYATRLGEAWGVGQAGSENGVVIAVVPGDEQGRRLVHIAVGYGLEGVIPDITAKRIVENEILPRFRDGNYYQGLDDGTHVIMQLASGEFAASDYDAAHEAPPAAVFIPFVLIILLVFFLSRRRNAYDGVGKNIPFWTLLWLLTHSNRGSKGSFGNFSSGKGSFGGGRSFGGGGGSFRGFGGGRFGGGGAGGSW